LPLFLEYRLVLESGDGEDLRIVRVAGKKAALGFTI